LSAPSSCSPTDFETTRASGSVAKSAGVWSSNPAAQARGIDSIAAPQEIAKVVTFLAGPDASFITGQCYQVNGGAVMP
jgi:NAD(P)-dependent dehydrogenase (short-subunit alcohol dehydrogenase family)